MIGAARFAALACGVTAMLFAATVAADGGIKPGSPGDKWMSATSEDHGAPLIHSLRSSALELSNRARYKWRVGITWQFHHPQGNGMPGAEDRAPMIAIDDAIHRDFERGDELRIVYFTTGGGIREVMLYGTSESAAWARIDTLAKQFPDWFRGDRARWSYVKQDADWSAYRAVLAMLRPSPR